MHSLDDVYESFELLEDWSERYRFLIELGEELTPMEDALKTDATKVKGCLSQVWVVGRREGDVMRFFADSDAHIVRGLVALVMRMYDGKSPAEIVGFDHQGVLVKLGLDKHLSPGRSNGLHSMIKRIVALAQVELANAPSA
ncbi:MAG: SufE family protein [Sandaracinus sp.]|nr:SufE family protein [Myxococcales bacterium]MCB9615243.1 SufE family protein [Sandaracinus sp.]MCB9620965.1 SufE family protein [Sandaracinus sp.]MCB9625230.1 SufE family protein [Sandaracinus sp.]